MALADVRGPEALSSATNALAIAADWKAREPDSIPATELLARATFFVAMSTAYPEGLPHWQEADRLYHELLARDPGGPGRLRNAALTQKYLGAQIEAAGDWDRALEHYQRAYALDERRIEATPDDLRAQLDFAIDQSNVASIFWRLDERQRAIEWYERSLETRERLAAADPQDVHKRGRVSYIHVQLGRLYYETARLDLGRQHIETAIDLLVPLAASDSALSLDLGHAQLTAGDIARATARHAAACAAYEAAVGWYAAAAELPQIPIHQEYKAEAERQARACGARRP